MYIFGDTCKGMPYVNAPKKWLLGCVEQQHFDLYYWSRNASPSAKLFFVEYFIWIQQLSLKIDKKLVLQMLGVDNCEPMYIIWEILTTKLNGSSEKIEKTYWSLKPAVRLNTFYRDEIQFCAHFTKRKKHTMHYRYSHSLRRGGFAAFWLKFLHMRSTNRSVEHVLHYPASYKTRNCGWIH